jgi:hypothetical protein
MHSPHKLEVPAIISMKTNKVKSEHISGANHLILIFFENTPNPDLNVAKIKGQKETNNNY